MNVKLKVYLWTAKYELHFKVDMEQSIKALQNNFQTAYDPETDPFQRILVKNNGMNYEVFRKGIIRVHGKHLSSKPQAEQFCKHLAHFLKPKNARSPP